jgi:hypothetical protein
LGPVFFANGARRVGWLENWARRQKLDEEVRPVSWSEWVRSGYRSIEFGQWADARRAYVQSLGVTRDAGPVATEILRHACRLFEQGRTGDAFDLVDLLGELPEARQGALAPDWARAALVLAVEQGDRQRATDLLGRYTRLLEATRESVDGSGWSRVMPDVLSRARRLVGQAG